MAKKNTTTVAEQDDWQADMDMRCLMDAEKIRKDPKRLKAAKELAKKKLLDMAAVANESD